MRQRRQRSLQTFDFTAACLKCHRTMSAQHVLRERLNLPGAYRPSRRCTSFKIKFVDVIASILSDKLENWFAFRIAKHLAMRRRTVEPRSKRSCAPREQDIRVDILGRLVACVTSQQPTIVASIAASQDKRGRPTYFFLAQNVLIELLRLGRPRSLRPSARQTIAL